MAHSQTIDFNRPGWPERWLDAGESRRIEITPGAVERITANFFDGKNLVAHGTGATIETAISACREGWAVVVNANPRGTL